MGERKKNPWSTKASWKNLLISFIHSFQYLPGDDGLYFLILPLSVGHSGLNSTKYPKNDKDDFVYDSPHFFSPTPLAIYIVLFIVSKFNLKPVVHKPTIHIILAVSKNHVSKLEMYFDVRTLESFQTKSPSSSEDASASWTGSYLRLYIQTSLSRV